MALSSTTVTNMVKNCKQRIETSGKVIQNIFHEAVDLSLGKKEVNNYLSKRRFKKSQKKWFDKDCIRLKYLANKTAILKHKNPWNNNLRVSHRLKEFKNICRIKKNQFWQNEMMKLENINNVENFWKNWKQMGEDLINHNSLSENVDGQQWENHFKKLYTRIDDDIDEIMKKSDIPVNQVLNEKINMEELKTKRT